MTEISNLLARNLIDISNERNQVDRMAAVQELWAQHGVLMVDDGTYIGHSEVEVAAGDLLRRYPEFVSLCMASRMRLRHPVDRDGLLEQPVKAQRSPVRT